MMAVLKLRGKFILGQGQMKILGLINSYFWAQMNLRCARLVGQREAGAAAGQPTLALPPTLLVPLPTLDAATRRTRARAEPQHDAVVRSGDARAEDQQPARAGRATFRAAARARAQRWVRCTYSKRSFPDRMFR